MYCVCGMLAGSRYYYGRIHRRWRLLIFIQQAGAAALLLLTHTAPNNMYLPSANCGDVPAHYIITPITGGDCSSSSAIGWRSLFRVSRRAVKPVLHGDSRWHFLNIAE